MNDATIPLIPVRMLNEYVYCPRLAYMMWVQGEFAHSAKTVEGAIRDTWMGEESGNLTVANLQAEGEKSANRVEPPHPLNSWRCRGRTVRNSSKS